jgi:hypothetical protein
VPEAVLSFGGRYGCKRAPAGETTGSDEVGMVESVHADRLRNMPARNGRRGRARVRCGCTVAERGPVIIFLHTAKVGLRLNALSLSVN